MDEAQVAYGKTPGDAAAVSALVHAMVKLNRVAGAGTLCTIFGLPDKSLTIYAASCSGLGALSVGMAGISVDRCCLQQCAAVVPSQSPMSGVHWDVVLENAAHLSWACAD